MMSRLLYPLSRESPCGGDWRNVRSACRTQTGTLSQSFMAEAQNSLAVVLPGSTALSEIIDNLVHSPKRGIFYGQKGVLVELNRHRGYSPVFFHQKGEQ